jgi:DNA-binding response OmpR family regulator
MARDRAATILVVEDDTSIQDLLHEILAEEGYRVLLADDGVHGVRLAATDPPHVILLDMRIPPLSGADVLVRLRDDPATADIPVIAVTGLRLRVEERPGGFDGWIEKPFDLDVLLEQIGQLAERPSSIPTSSTAAGGMR